MMAYAVIWLALALLGCVPCSGHPVNMAVQSFVGESVELICNAAQKGRVDWQFRVDETQADSYICMAGRVLDKHVPKFELDSANNSTLIVHSLTVNDTGLYTCFDDSGFGQTFTVQLVVEDLDTTTTTSQTGGPTIVVLIAVVVVVVIIVIIVVVIVIVVVAVRRRSGNVQVAKKQKSKEVKQLIGADDCSTHKLLGELSTRNSVYGVAFLADIYYVVCIWSEKILRFGTAGEERPGFDVNDMEEPRDIVACPDNKVLYVADLLHGKGRIWRVRPSGQMTQILPKDSEASFVPWSLSVSFRRLLVTTHDDLVLLYSSDGALLRTVPLPNMKIRHAVVTSRGTFIVSHLKPQPQVSEVGDDGKVIHSFADHRYLTCPCHLSLTGDAVLVVDSGKRHVVSLNYGDVAFKAVLLNEQCGQLHESPQRLCYVPESRQLLVGSECGGVQVYEELQAA